MSESVKVLNTKAVPNNIKSRGNTSIFLSILNAVFIFYSSLTKLNKTMGNCTFSVQSDGAYVTYVPTGGADPVSKKLGSGNYTITFTLEIDLLNGLNQTISKREETYHMYVNEGNVTTDFEEIGTYRSTAGQGWTYVRLVSISISDN